MRQERNLGIKCGCYYFLFEKKTVKRLFNVTCSPSYRHSNHKYPFNTSHSSRYV